MFVHSTIVSETIIVFSGGERRGEERREEKLGMVTFKSFLKR
jgi:hypothetical protein